MKPQRRSTRMIPRWKTEEEEREILACFDTEHNAELRMLRKLYRLFVSCSVSVLSCAADRSLSSATIWCRGQPVDNEVPRRCDMRMACRGSQSGRILWRQMIVKFSWFDTFAVASYLLGRLGIILCAWAKRRAGRIEEWEADDRIYEPKNDIILQTVAKLLRPTDDNFGLCDPFRSSRGRAELFRRCGHGSA